MKFDQVATYNIAMLFKFSESCLADISSSECPKPASGKTSVAAGISDNADAISGISSSNAALAAKDTHIGE